MRGRSESAAAAVGGSVKKARAFALSALAALAGLATGCAGPGDGESPATVRLIDLVAQARVEASSASASASEPPAEARPSRLLRPRDRERVARIALEARPGEIDERLAILTSGGTALGFAPPRGGRFRLRLGIGRPSAEAAAGDAPARAVVRLIAGAGGARTLVDRIVEPRRWSEVDLALDLPAAAEIELSAVGSGASWIAWSAPELVARRADGWDLILISLDTLRADHLGSYGHDRPTSPHLDALAGDGFRFARAYSSAPWTLPSHQSLFNGLYPRSHGDLRSPPLARVLWRAGFRTEARAGGGVMDYRMGTLSQGFDSYRYQDWIRDLDGLEASLAASDGRRRFLFLHTYEPHDPYIDTRFAADLPGGRVDRYFDKGLYPPIRHDMTDDEKRYVEALYDGDIAYTDEQLGALLGRLEAAGALERSIVAIVSDHGEQFWEHGSWRHGQNLYDEQIHVPLILWLPAELRRRLGLPRSAVIDDQVRLIDLYPTLLELLGVALPRPVQGRSLVPLLAGGELPEAEALAEDVNVVDTESRAVRFRGFKLLRTWSSNPAKPPEIRELYDLRRDPGERLNLIDRRPEVAAELQRLLDRLAGGEWSGEGGALDTDDLDPDLRRDLEALGYIGDG